MALQIDVAEFGGLVAEGVLYGIYLLLFGYSGYLLVSRRKRGELISYPMLLVALLMFILVTGQIIADTFNLFVAFFHHDTREERIKYLEDVSQQLFAWKHNILNATLLVGDLFVCYRCYIIWGRDLRIIALPLSLSAASVACGIQVTWATQHLASTTVKAQTSWITALFTLSLCANAISTSLLAFKIWQVDRAARRFMAGSGSSLVPVLRIVVESGAMNAAYLFVYTMTLVTGTEALETMAEMATAVISIIATLLIIRVQTNAEREARYTTGRAVSTFRASPRKNEPSGQVKTISTDGTLEGTQSPSQSADLNVIAV